MDSKEIKLYLEELGGNNYEAFVCMYPYYLFSILSKDL